MSRVQWLFRSASTTTYNRTRCEGQEEEKNNKKKEDFMQTGGA